MTSNSDSEQKQRKSQKIFNQLFGSKSQKTGKLDKPGLLPNHPKIPGSSKSAKNPSQDSGSGETDHETDFQGKILSSYSRCEVGGSVLNGHFCHYKNCQIFGNLTIFFWK